MTLKNSRNIYDHLKHLLNKNGVSAEQFIQMKEKYDSQKKQSGIGHYIDDIGKY